MKPSSVLSTTFATALLFSGNALADTHATVKEVSDSISERAGNALNLLPFEDSPSLADKGIHFSLPLGGYTPRVTNGLEEGVLGVGGTQTIGGFNNKPSAKCMVLDNCELKPKSKGGLGFKAQIKF